MSGPMLHMQILIYGSSSTDPVSDDRYGIHQRRAEIELRPRAPQENMSQSEWREFSRQIMLAAWHDTKHSAQWYCEFCDQPATETQWLLFTWTHLTPPRVVVYVHNVCTTRDGPCATTLRTLVGAFQHMGEDVSFPLSASCANCQDEATARQALSRCARCKMTRYCGPECQTADWSRHKQTCKMIQRATWVWN